MRGSGRTIYPLSAANTVRALLLAKSMECPVPDIVLVSTAKKAHRVDMSDSPQEAAMDRFVARENIKRYRKLASESSDPAERSRIMGLLAEEETKFKLELGHSDDPPEGRSPANAATENQIVADREEQRSGG